MFFDGSARSKPAVSLGGKTKKQEARADLLKRAQWDRRQREATRKKTTSACKIQAGYRGYRVRQTVCNDLRDEFDSKITILINTTCLDESTRELTSTLTRQLLYFYQSQKQTDRNRLSFLCQNYIKHKKMLETPSDLVVYRLQRLSVACCRAVATLSDVSVSAVAMPLRMLELITDAKTFGQNHNVATEIAIHAVENGWFSSLSHVLETSVPEPVEASSSSPSPLAESLLSLLFRPLSLSQKCKLEHRLQIYRHLASDIFSRHSIPSVKLFLLPAINSSPLFKFDVLLESLNSPSNSDTEPKSLTIKPTEDLLHSILTCGIAQLTQMPGKVTIDYLTALRFLLPAAVSVSPDEEDDSSISNFTACDLDSDRDELLERLDDGGHASQLLSVVHDGMSPLATVALTRIAHWMMVEKRQSIHQSRLLSGLSYSRPFLRAIWSYATSLSAPSVLGKSTSVVQQLCCGSQLSDRHLEITAVLFTVFSGLFCHSLFSLHDAEFHGDDKKSGSMPFSMHEIIEISAVLRDISITLLTEHAADKANLQLPSHQLSSSLERHRFHWLLTSVVQLVSQLYTRDGRRQYCPDEHWLARKTVRASLQQISVDSFLNGKADGQQQTSTITQNMLFLTTVPFIFPFQERVMLFSRILACDRRENQGELFHFNMGGDIEVTFRRDRVYEDAYAELNAQENLKKKLRVRVINAQGLEEAGIDGGGVFREFLSSLLRAGFDENLGLFCATVNRRLYPNAQAHLFHSNFIQHYTFLGRILAKALYENMLVELPLADFFLLKVLGCDVDVNHLASLDPEMYRHLLSLKSYDGDVEDLALTFSVVNSALGETEVVELKAGGQDIAVTSKNLIEYIHLVAHYRLNKQIHEHCVAFQQGFASVIDLSWLRMFNHKELQTLISGAETDIDIDDLKKNTSYSGEFNAEHDCIQAFWRIIKTFTTEEKSLLLRFVTSCSRPPLLGFKELDPKFCIHSAGFEDRLPTASTCMHLLKLPVYRDEATLKERILYAIHSGAGFELS